MARGLPACLLSGAWNGVWPGTAPGAFAVIGAMCLSKLCQQWAAHGAADNFTPAQSAVGVSERSQATTSPAPLSRS
ncbi:MAG: hypothetical protein ACR5LG_13530 [Sodalis sp. (in: enterobacteria)]|uniref:hypothetical protein n=1 Tax=Sodalis sp. (in: enterobacteria) TaxID=1898979 RepID=UPI003F36A470